MEGNTRYQIGVDINSNKCEKEKKPAKEKIQIGTMRCLRPDNEVTDVDAASTTSQNSKISEIMKCMFFRKKDTEVVEMKPEKAPVSKKKSLTLDRSERSRRVLKMESMREVPLEREAQPPDRPLTPPAAKRFLPSEDPAAAFLGYVNPQNRQIRRAYSDVMRATNTSSNKKQLQAREAFVIKQESQRNTNYRANRATERENSTVVKELRKTEDDDQYKDKDSQKPKQENNNNNIMSVVPGTTLSSEEYMPQHGNEEIQDLQEEIRRMNMHRLDGPPKRRRREGSISLSESNCSDSDSEEIERPRNPEPEMEHDKRNKNASMEEVIDGLYLKTQKKLDDLYQNGIGNMDTYRPESSIDEPDMNKFERDLFSMNESKETNREQVEHSEDKRDSNASDKRQENDADAKCQKGLVSDDLSKESAKNNNKYGAFVNCPGDENAEQRIDSLLNEVSIWAKDRENWLLGRTELGNKYDESKEHITLSQKVDFHNGRRSRADLMRLIDNEEIDRVRTSNEQRCNNWVDGKSNNPKCSQRTIDIITSPKLFSPRNTTNEVSEKTSDNNNSVNDNEITHSKIFSPRNGLNIPSHLNDIDKNVTGNDGHHVSVPTKRTYKGVAVIDYSESAVKEENIPNHKTKNNPVSILSDKHNEHNKTIINGIVIPTPTFDTETEDDRSTIDDNLSDLDRRVPYRARSPDSWLSSCGSPTNFLTKRGTKESDLNDSFETVSSLTVDSANVHRVAEANSAETAIEVVRQNPQTHAPYRGLDRQGTPMPNDSQHLPLPKSVSRHTQLQPIISSSFKQEKTKTQVQRLNSLNGINSLTGLPSMVNDGILKGTRNLNDFELSMNIQSRPFSEIPLTNSAPLNGISGNNRFIGNSGIYNGGNQNKSVAPDIVSVRPASETVKRTDKVGMGHVMATDSNRDRNRYAKEIVHSMERQWQQPQKAFPDKYAIDINHKQDMSFLPQLLKGGYSYDKHSSQRLNSASENVAVNGLPLSPGDSNDSSSNDIKSQKPEVPPRYKYDNNTTESDVKTSFKISKRDSQLSGEPTKQRNNVNGGYTQPTKNGYTYDYSSLSRSKSKDNSESSSIETLSPREKIMPKSKRTDNVFDSQISDSKVKDQVGRSRLDATSFISQKDLSTNNKTTEQISHGSVSTAEKFRNNRNRRNQEMQWLMKDAAETEV